MISFVFRTNAPPPHVFPPYFGIKSGLYDNPELKLPLY